MNMKKLVALLLALVMVFALCACGPKDNQDTGKKDDGKKTVLFDRFWKWRNNNCTF